MTLPSLQGGLAALLWSDFKRSAREYLQTLLRVTLVTMMALHPALQSFAQDDAAPDQLPGGQMLRGTVSAVSANGMTVKNEDGELIQVVATTNTRVIRARQAAKFSDIHVGDGVGVGGVMDTAHHTLHAAFIGAIDAEEVRKAQAELGKSYLLGRITAIDVDALRLMVHRPDGVNQVIAVDEGTSFRRGGRNSSDMDAGARSRGGARQPSGETGESITLADIKVGESLAARGALKKGVFVPTELHVYTAEGRRRRTDEAGGSTASAGAGAGAHP